MMPRVSNKSMMPNFIHVVYDGVRYRAPSDEGRMEEWIVVNVWPRERVGFRIEWDRALIEARERGERECQTKRSTSGATDRTVR